MIISKTPFRISFFGGGTDYPTWFMENGGRVLSVSIDKYCYITCRSLPPFFDHDIRVAWSRIENVKNTSDIYHPAVREGLKYMGIRHGISITHEGDLPARTGLGSSSTFIVGLLHVLYAYQGRMTDKLTLAKEAIYVEQEMIGDNVGCQDQIAAAMGGFNRIEFTAQGYNVSPVVLSKDILRAFESSLMLFYTGLARTASEIVDEQLKTMGNKQQEMRRMYALAGEGEARLVSGDIKGFGKLLDETWKIKRTLSNKISSSYVDDIYEAGTKAGAFGGKLLGAGGGGFVMFICPPEKQPAVKTALRNLLYVPVSPEFNGTHIIYYTPDNLDTVTQKGSMENE